ncbi:hypothetical protein [Streptomyces bugieae]|uniref:Lipoprotein n=1 Tax=Streptomyces bugieae TaxID=3098223 RepID=A0ABU7NGR4_9ACTN|nr:hypothetical protein [Streptomyces sp. DSM 41528]
MVAVTLVATGCTGTSGEPRSAGATSVASAPARLWPDRAPAPQPPPDKTGLDGPSPLPGLPRVPSGNIRTLNALDVVKAQIAEDARHDSPAFDKATEREINQCGDHPRRCPVRAPEYQDLTHDGKDELIVGIEGKEHALAIWAYMLRGGVVNRILDTAGTPLSVDVSDGDVIMREPTDSPGYEMRTVHAWDERRQTMEIRTMEFDQKVSSPAPERTPSPERTRSPERTPSPVRTHAPGHTS